jgi:hypothetical protein
MIDTGGSYLANAPTFGAVLVKGMPFPADGVSPKAPTVGTLADLGRPAS